MTLITERRKKQNEIDAKIASLFDKLKSENPQASNSLIQKEIAKRMERTPQAIYNRLRLLGKLQPMQ